MANNDGSQDQNGLSNTNKVLIALAVLLVAVGMYLASRGEDSGSDDNGQNSEQNENSEQGNNPTPAPTPAPTAEQTDGQAEGNVQATGILRESNNPARGNLMLESNVGVIYVTTSRDYSEQIGKQVTLQADGTFGKFSFLGFTGGSEITDEGNNDAGDVGGSPEEVGSVVFHGNLKNSDDTSRGNYIIVSGSTKVYLQSARNYSAWIGSDVTLDAIGTLDSFSEAVLTR